MLTLQQRSYLKVMNIDIWLSNQAVLTYWSTEVFDHSGKAVATLLAVASQQGDLRQQENTLLSNMLMALGQASVDLRLSEQVPSLNTKLLVVLGATINKQLVMDGTELLTIDYTVEHLLKNPQLKAEVWQNLCQSSSLRSALLDHHHANSSLPSG
ncbi:MAG: hypothetical protein P1U63_04710 [Coxiellaceae bacterium]|nr:hypothetical protein [Coxiellaceae bacterium]